MARLVYLEQALRLVRAARQLISDKKNWTASVLACDANCVPKQLTSEDATRWCALGALERTRIVSHFSVHSIHVVLDALDLSRTGLIRLNDDGGHEAVIHRMAQAEAHLEKDGEALVTKYMEANPSWE